MGDMSHISFKSINYSTNVPDMLTDNDNNDDAGHMLTTIVHLWSMTR